MKQTIRTRILKLSTVGIFTALAVVLVMLIHFPIFPALSFLEYDPGDVPIYLLTMILGPMYGIAMTVITSIIQGVTVSAGSGVVGIVMHILATGSYVLVLGLLRRRMRGKAGIWAGNIAGILLMTAVMALWNLIFTPYFMGIPMQALLPLYPLIVLFNLIKGAANGACAVILYFATQKMWHRMFSR